MTSRAPARIAVRAPAKLNLGLRITGRRSDGYHELDSVFVPIDLADELQVELGPAAESSVALVQEGETAGLPEAGVENLAARAARAFLDAAKLRARVELRLSKRIPVAAGLGGGSSDAAAVLRALDALRPGALERQRLAELALGLGADVPFFLDPRPARVRGVGERIDPLEGVSGFDLLLVHPGVPLSTADVYAAYDRRGGDAGCGSSRSARLPGGIDLGNDLEAAAEALCPDLARLRDALERLGPLGVGMSGSGPTLFGVFPSPADAEAARQRLALTPPAWARVARSLGSG